MEAYRNARAKFFAAIQRAKSVSVGSSGVLSTAYQMFYSSVLFTRLVVTGISIQKLLPDDDPKAHWDFSAVASITRNLSECYLVQYFLCFDDIDKDEEEARFLMMHLHDHNTRRKMLSEFEPNNADFGDSSDAVQADLVDRISKTRHFNSLSEKKQRELIRGEKPPFVQDEVLERMGIDRNGFRGLYRLFSAHTHSGPMAFYRMADQGRGGGVENPVDIEYMVIALEFATDVIQRATVAMLKIFPNAENRGARILDK